VRRVRTRRGIRLVEGGAVLSEILDRPGPTHSVFDVLAAAVCVLARGPEVGLLGFAGGGVVAPLRAMGFGGTIDAVDLDDRGERIFRDLSTSWRGPLTFELGEASLWLRRRRGRFDAVIEDLSITAERGVTKPEISWPSLPRVVRRGLRGSGVAVVNLLPVRGLSWSALIHRSGRAYPERRVVLLEEFENRVLIGASALPSARRLSIQLRETLGSIGSRLAGTISVRSGD